jgi:hypothetical protein
MGAKPRSSIKENHLLVLCQSASCWSSTAFTCSRLSSTVRGWRASDEGPGRYELALVLLRVVEAGPATDCGGVAWRALWNGVNGGGGDQVRDDGGRRAS